MMIQSKDDLNIYLFGFPRLHQASRVIQLPRRKMYGLLAYLSFAKRQFSRDKLADLFWPQYDGCHARGSLRVVLSEIHKIIDPEILPVTNDLIGPLDLKRISVDIEEFQIAMAQLRLVQYQGIESNMNLLKKAVSLYSGDFMYGYTLKNCRQFSEWLFQQSEYLHRELRFALGRLVAICEDTGKYDEGITFCRRFIEEDYLNEDAHCSLMRMYAATGQRESAINQFRLCKKALIEEMELSPEESTVELYESILHSRPKRIQTAMSSRLVTPRLAVLPFKSLTDEQEWFSDGMTDALITELSGRNGLEVISYNSSRLFQNTDKSVRQVASELNVHHILNGTVLKAGDDVRISAQLVEAAGDRLVWGESYRGSFTGILELQERIARTITSKVTGELIPQRKTPAPAEIRSEANEACLMGDFHLRKSESDEEIDIARKYYQEAADKDPTCADAFAGLAFTYFSILGGGRELMPTDESRIIVKQCIQKALKINPENVRAHMVLAGSLWEWDFDFQGAAGEFEEALRINPQHIESLCWYAELKLFLGRVGEMFTLVQRAYSLNPLDIITLDHLYRFYRFKLQYRRCLEILSRIDELFPGQSNTDWARSIIYIRLGQYETAIKHVKKALAALPDYDAYRSVLSYAYGMAGQTKEAIDIITEMIQDRKNKESIRAYDISMAYHAVGMDDQALDWLELAYEEDKLYMSDALTQPLWGSLHWDPRFQEIVGRVGLPHQLEHIIKALAIQRAGESSL